MLSVSQVGNGQTTTSVNTPWYSGSTDTNWGGGGGSSTSNSNSGGSSSSSTSNADAPAPGSIYQYSYNGYGTSTNVSTLCPNPLCSFARLAAEVYEVKPCLRSDVISAHNIQTEKLLIAP